MVNLNIKALAPLSHGGYYEGVDAGNINQFRKMPIISIDGNIYEVPVISGNAIRGIIRRHIARDFF